jgi:hypothetical protein
MKPHQEVCDVRLLGQDLTSPEGEIPR